MMLALPLAYALGSLLNFALIWVLFKKDFLHGKSSKLFITFIQSAIGAGVMGMVSYIFLGIFDDIFSLATGRGVFLQGFLSGILGIISGLLTLMLMKNQELKDLTTALGHKFWRGRVIAPEQREL
jgi:peptidoglycan biosynthesis protein MviN/MurJ (putative lipid II flippase)